MAFEVHRYYLIPVRLRQRGKHAIAVVPCVVDHTGQVAKCLDRLCDGLTAALVVGDVRLIHDCPTTGCEDIVHNRLRCIDIDIVNEYRRALASEDACVSSTQATPRARDDDDAFITNSHKNS